MEELRTEMAFGRLRLQMFGSLRVTSPDGADHTPPSAKARAILAMLATSSGLRRSRSWLQNRLWRDRGAAQSAGSLRQALLEIRKSLGPHADALVASRSFVELKSDLVEIAKRPKHVGSDAAFLDDLDLREPAFLEWLGETRTLLHTARASSDTLLRPPPRRPTIIIDVASQQRIQHEFFARILYDHVARLLTEAVDVDVLRGPMTPEECMWQPANALLIQLHLVDSPKGGVWIRASLEDLSSTKIRWSNSSMLTTSLIEIDDNWQILALLHQLVFAAVEALACEDPISGTGPDYQAAILAAAAFRRMFRLQHQDLEAATGMIDRAIEAAPRGLFHAVRAQLSTIRFVERQSDAKSLCDSVESDVTAALAAEPMNSSVLAAVANARLVFRNDVESSLILARQGVRANRSNPLAWWSLANAALYAGDHDTAYAAAVTAQQLADSSGLKSWADFQRSLTASVRGELTEGMAFARSAHAMAPSFRPPLRYLIALEAKFGDDQGARTMAARLAALESDFTVNRMMFDPSYPASMLRRSRLADAPLLKTLDV